MMGSSKAVRDVLAERQRQISAEGWTPEHDDTHVHGQMAAAALCYLAEDISHWARQQAHGCYWPWDAEWWKPADHRRNLVKAGALILAEIERLDRCTPDLPSAPDHIGGITNMVPDSECEPAGMTRPGDVLHDC